MCNQFNETEAYNKAMNMGKNVTSSDISNVKNNLSSMNRGPIARIWDKVMSLWNAFNSPSTPAGVKTIIIGGLIYLVCPVDLIPDLIPVLGLSDDVFVVTQVFNQFHKLMSNKNKK